MTFDELPARFLARVNREGPVPLHVPHLGACWVWTGACSSGYGKALVEGRIQRLHRYVFWRLNGWWPPEVAHSCDNPPCVRPTHLFPATHAENVADMNAKGRHTKGGWRHPNPRRANVERVCR